MRSSRARRPQEVAMRRAHRPTRTTIRPCPEKEKEKVKTEKQT
jgi:hypothetical protein